MSNRLAVSLGRQLQASNSDVEVYAYGLEIMLEYWSNSPG